ncbi:hypothetical protein [Streptomyces sp. NPDC097640]|uniref:hypothetical protein n=1 Tax=Streptomyces sp. NPDC097640 TaxID=3157229 RepID=UPI00332F834E
MSTGWRWEYDPDHAHVAGGIPAHVVTEVERLAGQLTDLAGMGVDVSDFGNGPRPGGLRRMDAAGGWTLTRFGAQRVGLRTAYVARPVSDPPASSDRFDL